MRTVFLAASAAAALAFAAPAMAQDEPGVDFTGPRAEAIVGWDRVEDDSIYGPTKDGVVYGGAIGYDVQLGKAVIGAEGEITGATTRDHDTGVLVAGDSLKVHAGRDLYVGGRVGFTVGNRALIYAKGGYTNAQIRTDYTSTANSSKYSENYDGWRAGAGAEVKLSDRIYAKAEYRMSNYDTRFNNQDIKRHQVVGGLGVRF
jgi:outer membrane immunogenic protein